LARDGSLDGAPTLLNPSTDQGKQILGEQALQAVKRCCPIPMPDAFAELYNYWRTVDLYFRGEPPIENGPRRWAKLPVRPAIRRLFRPRRWARKI